MIESYLVKGLKEVMFSGVISFNLNVEKGEIKGRINNILLDGILRNQARLIYNA